MVINFKNLSKTLDKIIEAGWLLIFGLSPIFFCPWVYGTWQVGEYFLFQVLTEIILFVWLIRIIIQPKSDLPWMEIYKKYWQKIKFILPAIIFIIILGLATIFSRSPYHSFWGYYQRKMGYISWLHFFAFFSILFFNLKNKKQIDRIFYVIIGALTAVVIYGFLQILGFDPFYWSESPFFSYRIFSTLGQPNFLASWLLLVMPIIFWALLKAKEHLSNNNLFDRIFKRPLIACLLFGSVIILVLTQSRGGWIDAVAHFP
ncbi:MAG: hypothetical protein PHN27_04355 [Patescibacteria group bacterium]|nr:hypothetical protein [Patescibacteria group bacterium]